MSMPMTGQFPDILLLFYSCFETELIYFEICRLFISLAKKPSGELKKTQSKTKEIKTEQTAETKKTTKKCSYMK